MLQCRQPGLLDHIGGTVLINDQAPGQGADEPGMSQKFFVIHDEGNIPERIPSKSCLLGFLKVIMPQQRDLFQKNRIRVVIAIIFPVRMQDKALRHVFVISVRSFRGGSQNVHDNRWESPPPRLIPGGDAGGVGHPSHLQFKYRSWLFLDLVCL